MSIGGCCSDIWILGKHRTPGPVDNLLSLNGISNISLILEKGLEDEFFKSSPIRSELSEAYVSNDPFFKTVDLKDAESRFCKFRTDFPHFSMLHNDWALERTQEIIKERIQTLYNFIDEVKDNPNYYLCYCLCAKDFSDDIYDEAHFKKTEFKNAIKLLKKLGLWEKTIIIGNKKTKFNSADKMSFQFHSDSAKKIAGKNYCEIHNLGFKPIQGWSMAEVSIISQVEFDEFLRSFIGD